MKHKLWHKGDTVPDIVRITSNTVVHLVRRGTKWGRIILIGNGHSMNVDVSYKENHSSSVCELCDGKVTQIEPLTKRPDDELFMLEKSANVYAFYPSFECKGGLKAVAKDVADLINQKWLDKHVVIAGHSKCAVCILEMHKYIDLSCKYTSVFVSGCFKGTPMANKEQFKELATQQKRRYLIPAYDLFVRNCVVNNDIAVGSEFIQQLPPIEEVCKYRKVTNCITTVEGPIPSQITGFLPKCCRLLQKLTHLDDGIVSLESQTLVTPALGSCDNFRERLFQYAHDNSFEKVLMCLLMEDNL